MWQVKQVGQKTSLAEQGTTVELKQKKKFYDLWKQGQAFSERLQHCGLYMQGEDMKAKAPSELKLPNVKSDNKRAF